MPDTSRVRRELLAWFEAHERDLPWRKTRDPYAVLLSEVMLQQTRVETVVPYFERFRARFPTIRHLADADVDRVLELWSGLGYYRRARSLWLAAREVVERFGGDLPRARADLESLPGIGPYSAGAIASIAYGAEEALVDGNVTRVLSRLHGVDAPVGSRASSERCWSIARELVRGERPGALNEALMELGATVCTPKSPGCVVCPVARECVALREGRVHELPVPKARRASPEVRLDAFVVRIGERVLVGKRPDTGLFAGLWEPPMSARASRGAPAPSWLVDLDATEEGRAARIEHVLTHRVFDVRVRRFGVARAPARVDVPGYVAAEFVDVRAEIATSTLARKVLTAAKPGRSASDKDDQRARRSAKTVRG